MNKKLKTLITLLFMGTAYSIIYALPFVQYVFYDPMVEGLKATNAQLGVLITIFGIGNLLAPIGGWFSDRFNHKKIFIGGLIATSLLNFLFAFNLNYKFALFIWFGLAISGLLVYFPAHIKIVRLLGDENNQGKIFGLSESAAGIGSVVINTIALFLFSRAISDIVGLKFAVIGYGLAGILAAIVLWFLIEVPDDIQSIKEEEKIKASDFLTVLKYPGTWFAGIAIFTTYTLYVSLSYFTPYFTSVLGVSVAFSGGLAIVRTYLIRFVGSPLGGMMGDKISSVSKVLAISFASALLIILGFLNLPVGANMTLIIALTLLISVFTYVSRGNMFAVPAEVKSPAKYAAMTAGITCAIGYSPDLFQFILFGHWLDKYGNQGYKYIFIYTMVILLLGIVSSVLTLNFKKKIDGKEFSGQSQLQ
ncbi:MAG: MFS transporter [Tissierellaceae bacterium]